MGFTFSPAPAPTPVFFVARQITEPLLKSDLFRFSLMDNCIVYLSASDQNSVAKINPYLYQSFFWQAHDYDH